MINFEISLEDDLPVGERHLEVEGLLAVLLGVVESELVELAELAAVPDLVLQGRNLGLQFVDRITTAIRKQSICDPLGIEMVDSGPNNQLLTR